MADYEMMLTQKRLRRKQMATTIGIVAFVLVVVILVLSGRKRTEEKQRAEIHNDDHLVTLSVVGDITIDDELVADALQSDGSYNFLPFFLEVSQQLYQADLTIGNLEMCFAGEPYGDEYSSAPEAYAQTLKLLGFDILQTANSKTLAAGVKGMESTIETIERNGMIPFGCYTSKSDRAENSVLIQEVNGIKIAFISFTKGFDGMAMPTGREYIANLLYTDYDSMYSEIDTASITAVVENAVKQEPDIIIALVHWGSAYKITPSETQEEITQLMLQSGVDVILGTHSHVVGPMGYTTVTLEKETREAFVAYSLGNFITTDSSNYVRDGVILNLTISKDDTTGETIIKEAEYVPTYVWDAGEAYPDRYKVIDLYHALEQYDTTYLGRVTEAGYAKLEAALEDVRSNTGCDFDIGYVPESEALPEGEATADSDSVSSSETEETTAETTEESSETTETTGESTAETTEETTEAAETTETAEETKTEAAESAESAEAETDETTQQETSESETVTDTDTQDTESLPEGE